MQVTFQVIIDTDSTSKIDKWDQEEMTHNILEALYNQVMNSSLCPRNSDISTTAITVQDEFGNTISKAV